MVCHTSILFHKHKLFSCVHDFDWFQKRCYKQWMQYEVFYECDSSAGCFVVSCKAKIRSRHYIKSDPVILIPVIQMF